MKFTLGTREHDFALRRLAREEAMPGAVRLAYTREPDWFTGQDVLGHFHQTIVGLDAHGNVAGSGVRAVRKVFVNGEPCDIGYLCGLRSFPEARRGLGLAQGYRFFRSLHEADRRTPVYLTTILESNAEAKTLLTSGRAGLPVYHDLGRVNTYRWTQSSRSRPSLPPNVRIGTVRGMPHAGLVEFLQREGEGRLFFPVIDKQTVASAPWQGFAGVNFCVAERGGEIVGVAGQWDQRDSRQIRIAGYSPALSLLRPAINALARRAELAFLPTLPRVGDNLNACFATLVCVKDDEPQIFAAVLRGLCDHALASGFTALIVSLHERSPLNATLNRSDRLFACQSRLYCACWEDGEAFFQTLDPAWIPHVEGGML